MKERCSIFLAIVRAERCRACPGCCGGVPRPEPAAVRPPMPVPAATLPPRCCWWCALLLLLPGAEDAAPSAEACWPR